MCNWQHFSSRMRAVALLLVALALVLLPAVSGSTHNSSQSSPAGPNCTSIKASATDGKIQDFGHSVHYYCPPAEAPLNQLFLMIPGIQPEVYHWPVETGASAGYHSVGISWFDKPASGGVCYESAWAKRTGQTMMLNASAAMATCAYHVMLMRLLGKDDPRVVQKRLP